jgi:hypothetical protein
MRWCRKHIGHGSWLALVALAINFIFAFGHVHALDGANSEHTLLRLVGAALDGDQSPNHPATPHCDYLCPICMAATAIGHALASGPPALPIEFAPVEIDPAVGFEVAIPESPRTAFQSRGPPIS